MKECANLEVCWIELQLMSAYFTDERERESNLFTCHRMMVYLAGALKQNVVS